MINSLPAKSKQADFSSKKLKMSALNQGRNEIRFNNSDGKCLLENWVEEVLHSTQFNGAGPTLINNCTRFKPSVDTLITVFYLVKTTLHMLERTYVAY